METTAPKEERVTSISEGRRKNANLGCLYKLLSLWGVPTGLVAIVGIVILISVLTKWRFYISSLSRDFARDGSRDGELAEPKPGLAPSSSLAARCPPAFGGGATRLSSSKSSRGWTDDIKSSEGGSLWRSRSTQLRKGGSYGGKEGMAVRHCCLDCNYWNRSRSSGRFHRLLKWDFRVNSGHFQYRCSFSSKRFACAGLDASRFMTGRFNAPLTYHLLTRTAIQTLAFRPRTPDYSIPRSGVLHKIRYSKVNFPCLFVPFFLFALPTFPFLRCEVCAWSLTESQPKKSFLTKNRT